MKDQKQSINKPMSLLSKSTLLIMLTHDSWLPMQPTTLCQLTDRTCQPIYQLFFINQDIKTFSSPPSRFLLDPLSSKHSRSHSLASTGFHIGDLYHRVLETLGGRHWEADSYQVQLCPRCHQLKKGAKEKA